MPGINSGNTRSARMATVTAVTFIVAFAPVLCGLGQKKGEAVTGECTADKTGKQEVDVSNPNTTLKLVCDNKYRNSVKPAFSKADFRVCTDASCEKPPLLSEYIKGATAQENTDVTATVLVEDLPPVARTFYIVCGDKEAQPCYIVVNVAASKAGGVTPGSPLSCAKPGGAITIKIAEKGSTAQFTCESWTLYPVASDRVLAEDCKKEVSLEGLVRSTKAKVYTLTADKKPPKKKWCFLCASPNVKPGHLGTASDYCLVHVESSSRTQSNSVIALAAMLPCVLATLRIT